MSKLYLLKNLTVFLRSLTWGLAILFACSIPSYRVNKIKIFDFDYFDKVVHFLLYFVFSIILYFDLLYYKKMLKKKFNIFLYVLLIPLFWGVLIEFIQYHFIATRKGSIYDIIANTCGILISLCTVLILRIYFPKIKL